MAVVTLYGRPDCHLCDEAREAILAQVGDGGGVEVREVNIEDDDALLARYLERIPVVELDGDVISELRLDPHELSQALAGLHTVEQ